MMLCIQLSLIICMLKGTSSSEGSSIPDTPPMPRLFGGRGTRGRVSSTTYAFMPDPKHTTYLSCNKPRPVPVPPFMPNPTEQQVADLDIGTLCRTSTICSSFGLGLKGHHPSRRAESVCTQRMHSFLHLFLACIAPGDQLGNCNHSFRSVCGGFPQTSQATAWMQAAQLMQEVMRPRDPGAL